MAALDQRDWQAAVSAVLPRSAGIEPKPWVQKVNLGAKFLRPRKVLNPGCGNVNAVLSARGQNLVYEYGEWQIDLGRRELLSNGVAVPLGARACEIIELPVPSVK